MAIPDDTELADAVVNELGIGQKQGQSYKNGLLFKEAPNTTMTATEYVNDIRIGGACVFVARMDVELWWEGSTLNWRVTRRDGPIHSGDADTPARALCEAAVEWKRLNP